MTITTTSAWDGRRAELELPEEVDLQVELAHVGSRTLAILVDLTFGATVLFTVYCLTALFAHNLAEDWLTKLSTNTINTVLALVVFGFQWGYFNLFEWLWNGQTPGKRMLHLRVIKANGSPVSGIDVLLRNLARPVDTAGPMGLIGLVMIFVSRKGQRLGDLMAQTLVIHEKAIDWSIFDQLEAPKEPGAAVLPAIRLSAGQWELLHRYLNRRNQFDAATRDRLAATLCDLFKPLTRGTELERQALAPEDWLVELARRT